MARDAADFYATLRGRFLLFRKPGAIACVGVYERGRERGCARRC